MKPSAIEPVISINSMYWYFTVDCIADCKQRSIEIIIDYVDFDYALNRLWKMICNYRHRSKFDLYFSKHKNLSTGNCASTYLFHPWWLISHIMKAVTAAIINNTYTELSIFIVLSNWLDNISYEQTQS